MGHIVFGPDPICVTVGICMPVLFISSHHLVDINLFYMDITLGYERELIKCFGDRDPIFKVTIAHKLTKAIICLYATGENTNI